MNQDENIQIAEKHIQGMTTRQIASEIGISQPTIVRRLNDPETKKYIENIQSDFINTNLLLAADNITHVISDYKSEIDSGSTNIVNYQKREHGFKASMRMLEGVGILPGANPSQIYMSIFASQTNIMSPVIQQVLSSISNNQDQSVDAEFYEST